MELKVEVMPSEAHIPDKRLGKIQYKLPEIPSNMLFVGQVKSGKTSLMYSMLSKGYVVNGKSVFDQIVVYCSTADSNEAWEQLPCKNIKVLNDFKSHELREYLEDLKQFQLQREKDKKRRHNVCLVFDDMASDMLLKIEKGQTRSTLEHLLLTSRHECNATIMFATQTYKSKGFLTPTVRANIRYYFLLKMNRVTIERIAEENSHNLTKDQFINLYYYVRKQPYHFLLIDMDEEAFKDGFTKVLLDFNDRPTPAEFYRLFVDGQEV